VSGILKFADFSLTLSVFPDRRNPDYFSFLVPATCLKCNQSTVHTHQACNQKFISRGICSHPLLSFPFPSLTYVHFPFTTKWPCKSS